MAKKMSKKNSATGRKVTVRRSTELRGVGAAARRCGVSHTHLRKVLEGERKLSAELAAKMKKLGLSAGQMKERV